MTVLVKLAQTTCSSPLSNLNLVYTGNMHKDRERKRGTDRGTRWQKGAPEVGHRHKTGAPEDRQGGGVRG